MRPGLGRGADLGCPLAGCNGCWVAEYYATGGWDGYCYPATVAWLGADPLLTCNTHTGVVAPPTGQPVKVNEIRRNTLTHCVGTSCSLYCEGTTYGAYLLDLTRLCSQRRRRRTAPYV